MENKMYFKNAIIYTQTYYKDVNEELESLGINIDNEYELMQMAFFYDSLVSWNEEAKGETGIRLNNGDRFVIPYSYQDFSKFIESIINAD